jgi:23S rRNA-/tRNA-specific pseudouridylate synthase
MKTLTSILESYSIFAYRFYDVQLRKHEEQEALIYLSNQFPWLNKDDWLLRLQKKLLFCQFFSNKTSSVFALTPSYHLRSGDRLWLPVLSIPEPDLNLSGPIYELLIDDGDLFVINKKPGVLSHASGRYHQSSLRNELKLNGLADVAFVHRLDRETSGCLVGARQSQTRRNLALLFQNHEVEKFYIALTFSQISRRIGDVFQVSGEIVQDQKSAIRLKLILNQNESKQSLTVLTVLNTWENYTLWLCQPITGRTNQIRVHFRSIQEWIVGDKIYYPDDESIFIRWAETNFLEPSEWEKLQTRHHLLHALAIQFPVSFRRDFTLLAPLPTSYWKFLPFQRCAHMFLESRESIQKILKKFEKKRVLHN